MPRGTGADTLQTRAERDVQRLVNGIATVMNVPEVDKTTGQPERPYYIPNLAGWLGTQLLAVANGEAPYWDLTKLNIVVLAIAVLLAIH